MRVLIVHNYYQLGGGEDAVAESEKQLLEAAGHEVLTYFVHNAQIRGFWSRIRVALGTIYSFGSRRRLAAVIKASRPDVIHVHNFFPLISPSVFTAAHRLGVPTVMTLHNFRTVCPTGFLYSDGKVCERSIGGPTWWAVPKRVYRGSLLGTLALVAMIEWHKLAGTWRRDVDVFIALSQFAKRKFVASGFPGSRIVVKPNSLGAVPLGTATLQSGKTALFVGRLSDEKGLKTLLEAWGSIGAPLRIAGTGPLADWVEANKSSDIVVLGALSREGIATEMRSAAFLVIPSVGHEMFPMTLAEAYSVGLPVIASSLGALAELVPDGITGLHFKAGDAADLSRAVRWALQNPDRMSEMGENAHQDHLEHLTPDENIAALTAIYQRAIDSRAATRRPHSRA